MVPSSMALGRDLRIGKTKKKEEAAEGGEGLLFLG